MAFPIPTAQWINTQPGYYENTVHLHINAFNNSGETVAYVNTKQPDHEENGFAFFDTMEEALNAF